MAPPALKSRAAKAPAEKLPPKVFFFFFFFFPERRKSFKEYQREEKIPSDGPQVFTPAIIHSFFFFSAAQRGGEAARRRGDRCEESCLFDLLDKL